MRSPATRPSNRTATISGWLAGFLLAGLTGSGCAGAVGQAPISAPPQPLTRATLAGPLCGTQRCQCRDEDGEAGLPPEGFKRYEFRIGPTSHQMWATVDDMVLYKSRERATECFYIDLRPGEHRVSLRASEESSFGARMLISEQGAQGPWWYGTFEFSCGGPGLCDLETLREWKRSLAGLGQKHDPCGSTKIAGVEWQTGRMPDNLHPSDLLLNLTLNVYSFVPEHPPGDPACAAAD